jgi:hypothetical protein
MRANSSIPSLSGCHAHTRRQRHDPPSRAFGEGGHACCANARQTPPKRAKPRQRAPRRRAGAKRTQLHPPPPPLLRCSAALLLRAPESPAKTRQNLPKPATPNTLAQNEPTLPVFVASPSRLRAFAAPPSPNCVKFPNEPTAPVSLRHPVTSPNTGHLQNPPPRVRCATFPAGNGLDPSGQGDWPVLPQLSAIGNTQSATHRGPHG